MNLVTATLLAGWLVGLAKGGLSAIGPMITVLMILVMPDAEKQAVGLVLLMLIVGDWFAMVNYWGLWDRRLIRWLLAGAVVGILIGAPLLNALPNEVVRRLVGVIGLLMAAYTLAQDRLSSLAYKPKDWHGSLAGGMAGFTSALSNAGGPPFNAYMLLQDVTPRIFVATATLFFALVNLLKLALFLLLSTDKDSVLPLHLLPSALPGMLLVPVGVWMGKKIVDYISRGLFAAIVWVGLVISSALLLR